MKLMPCPLNGPRPLSEFAYGGEVRAMPEPDTCTDAEWTDYVFNSQQRSRHEARVVVSHAVGLLVHRRARHRAR